MSKPVIRRMHCRDCQAHLVAYADGQLSPRMARRVGYHLNTCARCYVVYVEQRNLTRELEASVPLVGATLEPQLGRVWSAIQADMARPSRVNKRSLTPYTVGVLVLVLAILLPWSLDNQPVALALPSLPAVPVTAEVTKTPTSSTQVAAAVISATATNAAIPAAKTPNAAARTYAP